jgi:hypothetical protein
LNGKTFSDEDLKEFEELNRAWGKNSGDDEHN